MITKIRLKNWKSHLDSEFDFTEGVNALIGINGAGKSSVLDAISFALFGTFPNHSNRKVGLDDLIMGRPAKKEEAEVYLEFSSAGKKYSVLRKVKAGKGTIQAEVRGDGRLIEVNPKGVTEHIEKVLQIDYPLFSKAVYSEQNNIDYFMTLAKGKRMQEIDKMLGIDRFESVRNSAGSIKNIVQAKLAEKIRLLSELKREGIESKIQAASTNIADLENSKKTADRELYLVNAHISEINGKLSEAEAKEKRFLEVEKRLAELKSAYREIWFSLQEKFALLKSLEKAAVLIEAEKTKTAILEIGNSIKADKEILESHRNKAANLNAEIKTISLSLSDLEKIKGPKCPVCENEIVAEKKTILKASRQKKLEELKKFLESSLKDVGGTKAKIEGLENESRAKAKALDRLDRMAGEFEIVDRLENKLKLIDIGGVESEKKLMEDQLLDVKMLRNLLPEKTKRLGELQSGLSSINFILKKESQILADLQKRQEIIKACQKDADAYIVMSSMLDSFIQAIKFSQEQLREEFTKTANNIMDSLWGSLYPYTDFESVRLAISEGDYVLEVKNTGSWVAVDFVSGGERTLACLALRVAFSLAFIPNLKWLILDEPTHNLDSNSIQKFSSVLSQEMGKFVNQIFLITHEAKLVEDIEGTVYRLERDKSANGATKVTKI